jgi:hypothetical protein
MAYVVTTRTRKGVIVKPDTKKAASRKTMRVATTFTGVAACAAFMTPAAMAGTARSAGPRSGNRPQANGRTDAVRPANTEQRSCTGGTSNWLHMAFAGTALCYGFKGTLGIDGSAVSEFCGGNNKGWFAGSSYGGKWVTHDFGHGTTYNHFTTQARPFFVYSVHISNYSGNDKCPLP